MNLVKGTRDVRIRAAQYGIHMMCFVVNRFDGYFDDQTEIAVRRYQQKYGLAATGTLNDPTWVSILNEVKDIQAALRRKGFYHGAIDGLGDPETFNAVKSFQSANGLAADAMVGSATRAKLMRSGSNEVQSSDLPLSQGASGDKVLYLQYGLYILCCDPNGVDGSFGAGTLAAVKKFQAKYGLTADGVVGADTWNKLCSLITVIQTALNAAGHNVGTVDGIAGPGTYAALINYQTANGLVADGMAGPATRTSLLGEAGDGGTDSFPLSQGATGSIVLALQYGLFICCYNPNGADGTFGPGTTAAVKKFQTKYGLPVTGIVDTQTWEKLREKISPLQKALRNRGYTLEGTNGVAGIQTYNAVIAFQQSAGLVADGMAGNATLTALGLESGNGYGTTSAVLSLNSNGALTNYLQHLLRALGYTTVNKTGVFDIATKDAVIAFQTSRYLDADGIVGPATWSAIFSAYNIPAAGTGVEKMVNIAKLELSLAFQEDNDNNITPYGQWYGMNSEPWCAMFVSWCAHYAGILGTKVPRFAYCPSGVNWYADRGKFFRTTSNYKVRIGDTVFFWSTTDNAVGHTGIVIDATPDTITTIEGNASNGVRRKTYSRYNTYVYGFGCNDGPVSQITYTPPTQEEIDEKCLSKFESLVKASSYYPTNDDNFELSLNQEIFLIYEPQFRVSVEFATSVNRYNNVSAATTFQISNNGEVSNGLIAEIEALETQLVGGYTVTDNLMEIFMEIGYGNIKLAYSTYMEGATTWLKSSMVACSSVEIDAYTSVEYSFVFSVAISDDDSNPDLDKMPVKKIIPFLQEEPDPVQLAARIAYLLPDKDSLENFASSLAVIGTIAAVVGIIYFILKLAGSIALA